MHPEISITSTLANQVLLNRKAVEKAIIIAMALNCQTPEKLAFFRKNYFYPDLPKNFQITQLNVYGPTSIGLDISQSSFSLNLLSYSILFLFQSSVSFNLISLSILFISRFSFSLNLISLSIFFLSQSYFSLNFLSLLMLLSSSFLFYSLHKLKWGF